MIKIRQERPGDYDAVYQVVKAAFSSAEHSDGQEQDLVAALRKGDSFVPQLSLVAIEDERIVGHILFTEVTVGKYKELALAPLSVLPSYQSRGIGLALMEAGHKRAKELGYHYSIVLGHPSYYPKAGYRPASSFGITAPFDAPDETFMALALNSGADRIWGVVQYDPAFGIQ